MLVALSRAISDTEELIRCHTPRWEVPKGDDKKMIRRWKRQIEKIDIIRREISRQLKAHKKSATP